MILYEVFLKLLSPRVIEQTYEVVCMKLFCIRVAEQTYKIVLMNFFLFLELQIKLMKLFL